MVRLMTGFYEGLLPTNQELSSEEKQMIVDACSELLRHQENAGMLPPGRLREDAFYRVTDKYIHTWEPEDE